MLDDFDLSDVIVVPDDLGNRRVFDVIFALPAGELPKLSDDFYRGFMDLVSEGYGTTHNQYKEAVSNIRDVGKI